VLTLAPIERRRLVGVPEDDLAVVQHYAWTGRPHRDLLPQLVDLLRRVWRMRAVAVDATGLGGPVASFLLGPSAPSRCLPVVFTGATKSALGWALQAAANGGRLRHYASDGSPEAATCWQ
jgi:hypothetical protein